jgi:hypothetical protein
MQLEVRRDVISKRQSLPLGTRRGVWPAIAALAMLAAPVSLACKSNESRRMSEQRHDTLESVGKEIAVAFPASATLIGVHRESGIDDLVAVKVEIPAADWPGFLARTPIDPSLFRPGERGLLGPDDGFWDPHKAVNLRTAQASLPNARALNIGYDDSRGGVFVVYVVNHGT